MPRHIRVPAVVALLISSIALSGCSLLGGHGEFSREELESAVKERGNNIMHSNPFPGKARSADCSGGIAKKVGATQKCEVSNGSDTFRMTVTVATTSPLTVDFPRRTD